MVKIPFLVKNGQKGRHGCVKSEHVLYDFEKLEIKPWLSSSESLLPFLRVPTHQYFNLVDLIDQVRVHDF